MLGLGVPRRVVTNSAKSSTRSRKSRTADEATLLDVAGALLYVEASLDDHIDRLGAQGRSPTVRRKLNCRRPRCARFSTR
jgi:chemosensory pili system protein ChpA (sensor histidine kinase/response regulator)